ncbi:HemK2/MTQ2 family protein methyltransferase [Nocardia wallacei]|uniref:HemK2/MTQ2 family protein methyltransferase n=1 Tax=Nocardia wallacei TaxID=480035 RepID=UPI00245880DE|nr:HemK2/MTQ2 family protein methyltransferase [Nocardia wallacei]
MIFFRAPGVYRPRADTRLLMRAMAAAAMPRDAEVLDVCTGTGAVAVEALRLGAKKVTAVDVSRSALLSAWVNSRLRGGRLELLHGEFDRVLRNRRFDTVLANPPYVPGPEPSAAHGAARAWEAGPNGRALLDPLCRMMPGLLNRRGTALIVHSALCDPDETMRLLRDGGLKAAVAAREPNEFGPVLHARASWLEAVGLIEPGRRHEELVVIRADRTAL